MKPTLSPSAVRAIIQKCRAHPGRVVMAQSGHAFGFIDGMLFECWSRRARSRVKAIIGRDVLSSRTSTP